MDEGEDSLDRLARLTINAFNVRAVAEAVPRATRQGWTPEARARAAEAARRSWTPERRQQLAELNRATGVSQQHRKGNRGPVGLTWRWTAEAKAKKAAAVREWHARRREETRARLEALGAPLPAYLTRPRPPSESAEPAPTAG